MGRLDGNALLADLIESFDMLARRRYLPRSTYLPTLLDSMQSTVNSYIDHDHIDICLFKFPSIVNLNLSLHRLSPSYV